MGRRQRFRHSTTTTSSEFSISESMYKMSQYVDNKQEVMLSKTCYCGYCGESFPRQDVKIFLPESNNKYVALCPCCGMDSVSGDMARFMKCDFSAFKNKRLKAS